MSGFFKKAKNKAKGVVESLRPPSRQGRSPSPVSPHTPGQSTPNLGGNATTTLVSPGSSAAQPTSSSSGSPTPAAPVYARPSEPPSALATTGSVIYELLATIRDASDMCLPLKAAVVGVLKVWDVCERTVQLNQEFVKHKEKLERLLKVTTTHEDEKGLSDNLRERLEEVAAALENLADAVQAKLDRGLTSRVLQSEKDIGEVKDLVEKIMSLIDVFEFEGGVRVKIGVEHVKSGVEQIQRGVDQLDEGIGQLHDGVERTQDGVERVKEDVSQVKDDVEQVKDGVEQVKDGVEQVQDGVEELKRQMSATEKERLSNSIAIALGKHHVPEAVYDAQHRSGCMQGTRIGVLDRVFRWIMDPKSQPIFWLGGMAGTGKTSIAWSTCERVQADDTLCLGGSFFCSRSTGSAAQRDVRCVIPTLVQLLARQSDEFAAALAAELKEEPDLAYKQVKVQVERLLRKPLAALSHSTKTVVFIIDALDECGDQPTATIPGDNSEAHAAVGEMLEALIDFSRSSTGLPVKFIVTSRPETHIRETSVTDTKVTSALHLHTIDETQVTNDIQLYISQMLSKAPAIDPWFTNEHVEILAARADGLFIFAATAIKYILGGGKGHRVKRLTKLVSPLYTMPAALAVAPLDLMYSSILMEASRSDLVEVDELQQMLKVLATILTARMSLSVDALAELLNLSTNYLRGCLDRLHAVVHLPEDNRDANLRTLHASFGDYLFTRSTPDIRIPSTLGHDELARGCLRRMMKDDFNFNISHSSSSYEPNPKTKPDWISLSLHYACLQWAHHIQSASVQSAFDEAVNTVFRPKFLCWLEVLSVLGEIGRASGLLRIAGFVTQSEEVSRFLRDANSFVASSRAAIEWNASHIYLSALPFAPKDSLVFQDFSSRLNGVISVETFDIDRHGGRLVMNLTGHEDMVSSVAYSPDGRLIASGSGDGTVRLWDTLTGEETMSPLRSNDGAVHCVAFAADGQRIVSGTENGALHIWEARSGHMAMPSLRGHSEVVYSVALSQDGRLVASGSADNSVRLWDAATGQAIAVLSGHDDDVNSVALSPDGHTLASGSDDSTIRLWNVHTHELQGQPLRGPRGWVFSVAFSQDGRSIAGAFYDTKEIHIWDVSSGDEIVAPLKTDSIVRCLVYAPGGSCLTSANLDGIRFWDWKTGQDVAPPLSGHSRAVSAISYSPDGLYIATASGDKTVRIWDAGHSQSMTERLPSHTGKVSSVAVSADGSFIVSGSADQTIRVWDSQTAEHTLPPLMGHRGEVLSVAVSADGQFIASGSADHTVRLWNAKTGEPVGEPLKGHRELVNDVAFSRDGQRLASASDDKTVGIWALADDGLPNLHQLHHTYRPLSVAFSSNGGLLAVGDSDGHVTVWDLSGDDVIKVATFRINYWDIFSVRFSPDDSKIVAASRENYVYVWDLKTQAQLQTLIGHTGWVRTVAYSPDGERLVTGSKDCTIRIWDVTTGQSINTLLGHGAIVRSVAFLPDGKTLVSGSDDGTIRLWDVTSTITPTSQSGLSPIDILTQALQDDGWLVGPSGERLVWLPQEYRANLVIPKGRTTVIADHRVVISTGSVLYQGKEWTECWRGVRSSTTTTSRQPF